MIAMRRVGLLLATIAAALIAFTGAAIAAPSPHRSC